MMVNQQWQWQKAPVQPVQPQPVQSQPVQPKGFSRTASPVASTLQALRQEGRPAFIGYFPYGFPDVPTSLEAMRVMVKSGVDIVEIGLPYSDPVMDGPVIQAASKCAIDNGVKVEGVFDAVRQVQADGARALVMSYWNLIMHHGVADFAARMAEAGGSGLVTPDLIVDESGEWIEQSDRYGLDRVYLVSPDSSDARLQITSRAARGFVYATSRMGVTGERTSMSNSAQNLVARVRQAGAPYVCVGIGVSTAQQASQVGAYADGVIVGSALVHCLLDDEGRPRKDRRKALESLAEVCSDLRWGISQARK